MKSNSNKLNDLKSTNPFIVPEGYMKGLTSQIMSQLPEKEIKVVNEISLMERMRPWLYLAAVFVGLGVFFKTIIGIGNGVDSVDNNDNLLVQSKSASILVSTIDQGLKEEDADYLDYIERQYADYLLAEEFSTND